jgi:hypothetical protein
MKTIRLISLGLVWLAGTSGWVLAFDGTAKKSVYRTDVTFFEPEKFTDANDSSSGSEKGRSAILDQLKTYLQQRAQDYVADGQKLTITVTDVDLAGEFEPWRVGALQDVRIVKDIYPPRINLSFKLVNANGETIKSGERQLRDLSVQITTTVVNANDPLRYEKAMLDEWLRAEFSRTKKA